MDKPRCYACRRNHPLKYCPQFKEWSVAVRRLTIKNKRYCLNCLAYDHERPWCTSRKRCNFEYRANVFCNAKHHTLLHQENRDPLSSSNEVQNCCFPESDEEDVPPIFRPYLTISTPEAIANAIPPSPRSSEGINDSPRDQCPKTQRAPAGSHPALVDMATQTSPVRKRLVVDKKDDNGPEIIVPENTSVFIPPIVRINLNYGGQKMYTTFLLDPKADQSYIQLEVAKWFPNFKPNNDGHPMAAVFVLEPAFPHNNEEQERVYLTVKSCPPIKVPEPIVDPGLLHHFKKYEPWAHPFFNTWREIDGVLSKEIISKIMRSISVHDEILPLVQLSKMGWVISGNWTGCNCHPSGGIC